MSDMETRALGKKCLNGVSNGTIECFYSLAVSITKKLDSLKHLCGLAFSDGSTQAEKLLKADTSPSGVSLQRALEEAVFGWT